MPFIVVTFIFQRGKGSDITSDAFLELHKRIVIGAVPFTAGAGTTGRAGVGRITLRTSNGFTKEGHLRDLEFIELIRGECEEVCDRVPLVNSPLDEEVETSEIGFLCLKYGETILVLESVDGIFM